MASVTDYCGVLVVEIEITSPSMVCQELINEYHLHICC